MTRGRKLGWSTGGRALFDRKEALINIVLLNRLLSDNRVRTGQMVENRVVVSAEIGPAEARPNHALLCQLVGNSQARRKILMANLHVGTVGNIS